VEVVQILPLCRVRLVDNSAAVAVVALTPILVLYVMEG
jgi:hypothetical protein